MTQTNPDLLERTSRHHFAINYAEPVYRERQRIADETFNEINETHYEGKLSLTRFSFVQTHPRMVAAYEEVNGYGGHGEMVIHPGFALARKREWVLKDFPHLGWSLVFRRLILKLTVQKACLELPDLVAQVERESLAAVQTRECNRLGLIEGFPAILARRRGSDDDDVPVLANWPFGGGDLEEYRGAITPRFHSMLCGGTRPPANQHVPALSLYDYFLRLNVAGEHGKLRDIFERQSERAERERLHGFPRLARVEQGRTDVDGLTPLSDEDRRVEPAWLRWENYLVAGMALLITQEKRYDELPILADALEDAGCDNGSLLRHLRAEIEHTRGCWAVNALVALALKMTPSD